MKKIDNQFYFVVIRATPVMGTEMFVLEHLIEAEIKRDIRMPVCLIKVANT
jgi:hypothetical protein